MIEVQDVIPEQMTNSQFHASVYMFYPELAKLVETQLPEQMVTLLTVERHEQLLVEESFNTPPVSLFSPNNSSTMVSSVYHEKQDFVEELIHASGFSKYLDKYYKTHSDIAFHPPYYNHFLEYLSNNKEKHVYWFL